MQTIPFIQIIRHHAFWAAVAAVLVGAGAYFATRKKRPSDVSETPPRDETGPSPAEPSARRVTTRQTETPAETGVRPIPFSQEEAIREAADNAKAFEGCYEELYTALESGKAETLRRKLSALSVRFRNLKAAPKAQAWFERIAGDPKTADAGKLVSAARAFFSGMESAGLRRCSEKVVRDNDETLRQYAFSGIGEPVSGGSFKVVKAAWLMNAKVVEQGFVENL